MRSTSFAVLIAFVAVLAGRAAQGVSAPLANDRYGHMHMKYERTWLGVDVANVDVWFDETTRDGLREIAAGQRYSDQIAERIARKALQARDVYVQVEFLRRAPLGEFLDAARKNLERARDTGYISQDTFASAWTGTRNDFARFAKRGFKKGDRLLYRASPGSLRTTVMAGDRILLDVTTPGEGARRAMIASYYAPRTDFRKGLIEDMFH